MLVRSIIFGFPLVQFDVAGIEHRQQRDPVLLVAIYMAKY